MMYRLFNESFHSIMHRHKPKSHHYSCRDPRCINRRTAVVEATAVNLQTRSLDASFAKVPICNRLILNYALIDLLIIEDNFR